MMMIVQLLLAPPKKGDFGAAGLFFHAGPALSATGGPIAMYLRAHTRNTRIRHV